MKCHFLSFQSNKFSIEYCENRKKSNQESVGECENDKNSEKYIEIYNKFKLFVGVGFVEFGENNKKKRL